MAIEIKELVSNSSVIVDLTDAESSKVYGGYAAIVLNDTGRADLAFRAGAIVLGKPANDLDVLFRQINLGIPSGTVGKGANLARTEGRGRYTVAVTGKKLEG